MFGALKKLFSKKSEETQSKAPPPNPPPAQEVKSAPVSARPPTSAVSPSKPTAPASVVQAPRSVSMPAAPAQPPAAPRQYAPPDPANSAAVPLELLVNALPVELADSVIGSHDGQVLLPLDKILPQLARGAVRFSFGELRHWSPGGVFRDDPAQDHVQIQLPLGELIRNIDPRLLQKKAPKKVLDAPPDLGNLFGPRGQPLTPTQIGTSNPVKTPMAATSQTTFTRAAAAPPRPVLQPVQPPMAAAPQRSQTAAPPASPSPPPAPVPTASAPAAPAQGAQPPISISGMNLPLQPARAPRTNLGTTPSVPAAEASWLPRVEPPVPAPSAPVAISGANLPPPSFAPRPSPQPAYAPAPPPAAMAQGQEKEMQLRIQDVSVNWPEAVRHEAAAIQGENTFIFIPLARIAPGLKGGKVSFSWKQLLEWMRPAPQFESANESVVVDLPLAVIAPLFLSQHRSGGAQKKITVGDNIPDLFASRSTAPSPSPSPLAPASAPLPVPPPQPRAVAPAVPTPAPVSMAKEPPFAPPPPASSAPVKKVWSPNDVIQVTCTLKGVAGAIITMPDGLLVAGQLPIPLKTETVAAFVPQIFKKLNEYALEAQMGELQGLTVSLTNGTWQIYRIQNVFFAVVGRLNETLPLSQLNAVAAEMAKQNH